jgi:hypothetical protein
MTVTPPRRAASPGRRGLVVAACCAAVLVAGLAAAVPASADRDYAVRFTRNAQGDITGTGNTLVTCLDDDAKCAAARDGTANGVDNNNNTRAVRYVDIDTDPRTFDSSAATLGLPAGARILFAGLYYGGRRSGSSRTLRIAVRAASVSESRRVTNVATLISGTQAPRFARAAVRIVPPRARLTG